MSTFDMRCITTVGDLLEAIAELGGTVSWNGEQPSRQARAGIDVEVDKAEAYERTLDWHDRDEDGHHLDPDPGDVRDFVGACLRGDRTIAAALLPRVVGPDGAQAAAETALRMGGRA